jgi:hypothetical protein
MIAFELKTKLYHKIFLFNNIFEFINYYINNYYLEPQEFLMIKSLCLEKINSVLFCNVKKKIFLENSSEIENIGTGIVHNSSEINLIFDEEV